MWERDHKLCTLEMTLYLQYLFRPVLFIDNYGGTSNDIVSNQYLHTAAGQQHNRHIGYMAATGLAPPPHGYAPVDKDADDVDMKYTKKSTLQSVGRWYRYGKWVPVI